MFRFRAFYGRGEVPTDPVTTPTPPLIAGVAGGMECRKHLAFDEGCFGCEIDRIQERLTETERKLADAEHWKQLAIDARYEEGIAHTKTRVELLEKSRALESLQEQARQGASERERLEKELALVRPILAAWKTLSDFAREGALEEAVRLAQSSPGGSK